MIQGTGSDVGKSVLIAGLCRLFTRQGLKVCPFKPQNMSNNAATTPDGGEIGRAQALQAQACKILPHVDMNPVLLKPQSEKGAQLIVRGQNRGRFDAREYQDYKASLLPEVLDSYHRLTAQADLILVEGAGSPAEINLRTGDIANMGFAEAADLPVILVGDIERGGVIAALYGTFMLLQKHEQDRLVGFIVNKFRGDTTLFAEGMTAIETRTDMQGLGIIPWFTQAHLLPAEDAMSLAQTNHRHSYQLFSTQSSPSVSSNMKASLHIVVPILSRIANFDDLDPLRAEPGVKLTLIPQGQPLPNADIIILPGSKATLTDLAFLRHQGWDIDLAAHIRRGGSVLGLCGGYQMLGRRIADPEGVEGPSGEAEGLGWLAIETILTGDKKLALFTGIECQSGALIQGYEIHIGKTTGPDMVRPMLRLESGRNEGARSVNGRVCGCYVHGLFTSDTFRRNWLQAHGGEIDLTLDYEAQIEQTLDQLADHLEAHMAIQSLLMLAESR